MSWGFYVQGSDQQLEVDELGSKLSIEIHCGVHFPAFGKKAFECQCDLLFPFNTVKLENWDKLREYHKTGLWEGLKIE